MENVPQLLGSAEYEAFKTAAEHELGFTVEGRVLNAADYGVPQRRRRAIVIGVRHGEVPWPAQTHYDPAGTLPFGGEPWRTFADAVKGLPRKPTGKNWHIGRNPRPETIVRYRHVPHDGGNRFQMQESLDAEGLGHLVPRLLAEQADRYDRRLRPALLEAARLHDPHRVLQAGEGPLPASERGPADHDPRGRPLHELPGRLRVPG